MQKLRLINYTVMIDDESIKPFVSIKDLRGALQVSFDKLCVFAEQGDTIKELRLANEANKNNGQALECQTAQQFLDDDERVPKFLKDSEGQKIQKLDLDGCPVWVKEPDPNNEGKFVAVPDYEPLYRDNPPTQLTPEARDTKRLLELIVDTTNQFIADYAGREMRPAMVTELYLAEGVTSINTRLFPLSRGVASLMVNNEDLADTEYFVRDSSGVISFLREQSGEISLSYQTARPLRVVSIGRQVALLIAKNLWQSIDRDTAESVQSESAAGIAVASFDPPRLLTPEVRTLLNQLKDYRVS